MARVASLRPRRRPRAGARFSPSVPIIRGASESRFPKRWKWPRSATTRSTRWDPCLNHVLLHQTVIGLEAIEQFQLANDYPDVLVGCTGGGSNFAGLVFPFLGEQLRGGKKVSVVAIEPAACPSLTRGQVRLRFRRHGAPDAAYEDVHAWVRASRRRRFMPADCAITAWRP